MLAAGARAQGAERGARHAWAQERKLFSALVEIRKIEADAAGVRPFDLCGDPTLMYVRAV